MERGLTGAIFADSRPRALAALMRSFGDLDSAEDLFPRPYRPYHSVRAALLEESRDIEAAIEALEVALSCEPTRQEADYLRGKIESLKKGPERLSD